MNFFDTFDSPFGPVTALLDNLGRLVEVTTSDKCFAHAELDPRKTQELRTQLGEYFCGSRQSFDLELAPVGTDFQKRVWAELVKIPFGQTATYGDLAHKLGLKHGARAVGRANATNPIWIIIPCHRVIGASGQLTGYAGGISMKQELLALESNQKGFDFPNDHALTIPITP